MSILDGVEHDRLLFMINRDGLALAKKFAIQSARQYRRAVMNKGDANKCQHYANTPRYRRGFIESYLHFKRFALAASEE